MIVPGVNPAGTLERSETLAGDLRLLAAAARHGAAVLLNEAEQVLMHALELEQCAREAAERAGSSRIDDLTARLNGAERELREAGRLASKARDDGRQDLVEANEALAGAVRVEMRVARRELARLGRTAGRSRVRAAPVDAERASPRASSAVRVVA